MATISERLAYILTFDTTQGVKSLEKLGGAAEKELGKADRRLDKLGSNLQKFGAGALAFAGIAGAGLFKMASGAADAQANMAALEQVVGETVAHNIGKWAEGSAKAVGMASKDAVAAATRFAQLGKIVGLGGQELSRFSTDLVGLSADFAAFNNSTPEKALEDIQSAFAGQTMPLRKYGIYLDNAALKNAYFRETGEKVSGTLTAQQRILAVNSELYRQGADMIGQWDRESGELVGQLATMKANLTNLSDEIGAGVLPHLITLMTVTSRVVGAFSSLDSATNGTIGTLATFGVGAIALAGAISMVVGRLILMRGQIALLATKFPAAMSAMKAAAGPMAVALVGLSLHAKAVADRNREISQSIQEMSRMADTALIEEFYRNMARAALNGGGAIKQLAQENLGAAQRVLELAEANNMSADVIKALEAAIKDEIKAREQAAATTEVETAAIESNTDATGENTDATDDNTEATEKANDVSQKAFDAAKRRAAALDDERKALEDLRSATVSSFNSGIAYQNQQARTAEAIRRVTNAAEFNKLAVGEQEQAIRDAQSAMLSQADAAVQMATDQAEANGKTLTGVQQTKIYKDELERLRAGLEGPLAGALDLYILRLATIPRSIATNVSLNLPKVARGGGGTQTLIPGAYGAEGAIVNRPTVALIADDGPEALVPLNKTPGNSPLPAGVGGGTTINQTIYYPAGYIPREVNSADRRYAQIQGPL